MGIILGLVVGVNVIILRIANRWREMFNHIKKNYHWPKIKRKNINGVRHYVDEEYNIYHSVTKVVGSIKSEGLEEWRKKVGDAVADYVMIKSGTYGTRLHKYCEAYLNNEKFSFDDLLSMAHFDNIKDRLNFINNIRGQEIQMFSKKMGLAGTVDCVADWDGKLSVIDFKTSSKKKPEEWIESYFLQATCYALMWEENTGEKIDQIVIVMSGEDLSQDTYIKDKAQYVERLYQVIEEFKKNA